MNGIDQIFDSLKSFYTILLKKITAFWHLTCDLIVKKQRENQDEFKK